MAEVSRFTVRITGPNRVSAAELIELVTSRQRLDEPEWTVSATEVDPPRRPYRTNPLTPPVEP